MAAEKRITKTDENRSNAAQAGLETAQKVSNTP